MTSHPKPLEIRAGVAGVCPPDTVVLSELRTTKIPIVPKKKKTLTQNHLNPASVKLS
jgi:hypothetical protein